MNGVNRVFILGTLGADPKPMTSREGKTYTSLSLATNRKWKDKNGDKAEKTDWHRITVWGRLAQICQEHLKKGQKVAVEGHLSTFDTDDNGAKKRHTVINADEVTFV